MIRKTKILYIYHSSQIGGGSNCLYNIIKAIDREKIKPIVVLKAEGPLIEKIKKCGVEVYIEKTISTVPYNKSFFNLTVIKNLFYLLLSFKRIKNIIKTLDPDIVYINTMMMHPYLKIAKAQCKRTIIHIREHWPDNSHTLQFKIAKNNIEKYADRVLAVNNKSASMINSHGKTTVVYDWIDFTERDEDYSFKQYFGENYEKLKIYIFMGGVDPIKGAKEVVESFSSYILDKNARLLILGTDSNMVYSGVRGSIARISKHINCDTYANRVKKIILRDSRIVCIPTTYKVKQIIEKSYCVLSYFTIPHANLILAESIYLGKVAIAANTPEAIEYSNGGESAILFEMNNKKDFIRAIKDMNNNYILHKNNAINGMSVNKSLFDPDINKNRLNKIYKSLI